MSEEDICNEIRALEERLQKLNLQREHISQHKSDEVDHGLHNLLLLSDSALPLGSFAFSAGLESFLAHTSRQSIGSNAAFFRDFLHMSMESLASTTLPFVQQAWIDPSSLQVLDNDLEASTPCTVTRRASVAQGRALLTMWQRSFKTQLVSTSDHQAKAQETLVSFSSLLFTSESTGAACDDTSDKWACTVSAHFAPLFGTLAAVMGLPLEQTLYLYLLNHSKMVLSAAIRASVLGPYQSQSVLAGESLKRQIDSLVKDQITHKINPEEASQTVPALDIWSGRHELVYSRIFNS